MAIPTRIKENILSQNPQVKKICLASLLDDDIKELVDLIKTNTYITSLDLSNGNIGDDGAQLLAELRLNELNLENNHITDQGAVFFRSSQIKKINLDGNDISYELLKSIPTAIFSLEEEAPISSLNEKHYRYHGNPSVIVPSPSTWTESIRAFFSFFSSKNSENSTTAVKQNSDSSYISPVKKGNLTK